MNEINQYLGNKFNREDLRLLLRLVVTLVDHGESLDIEITREILRDEKTVEKLLELNCRELKIISPYKSDNQKHIRKMLNEEFARLNHENEWEYFRVTNNGLNVIAHYILEMFSNADK